MEQLAEQAAPALRLALEGKVALELRRRLESLLLQLKTQPPPEQLRQLRALEILEHAGTVEARQMLQAIAMGAPEAHLTEDARAALHRLSRRATQ